MNPTAKKVQRTYLQLSLTSTLAGAFIWGINTLFLLRAGLSNTQAFTANAAALLAQVVFEVPTGVVADTWGRRLSYLLGSLTLTLGTVAYLIMWLINAPFVLWLVTSAVLGLGFTFFSGATEAWLVDALKDAKYTDKLEKVFAKGQIVNGVGMLSGAVIGGLVAQVAGITWPYVIRSIFFAIAGLVALVAMFDKGFTPKRPERLGREMRRILTNSLEHGFKKPSVRWIILTGPFGLGIAYYVFYAAQPHLLNIYGNSNAYLIAGIVAALVGGAQILGGVFSSRISLWFKKRTTLMIVMTLAASLGLFLVWLTAGFWLAVVLFMVWSLSLATIMPTRQAYINEQIPSEQRATILSFDSMITSVGGTAAQPVLGKVADTRGYPESFMFSGLLQLGALPFLLLAKRLKSTSDLSDKAVKTIADTQPADLGQ